MKIGELSKKYDIPTTTIRYYIDTGILAPNKNNSQYIFTDVDKRELEIVLKLKSLTFSMDEILNFMSIGRTYCINDHKINERLLVAYENKRENLRITEVKTQQAISSLNEEIKSLRQTPLRVPKKLGIPTFFMDKLVCPKCGGYFNISKVQLYDNQVYSGQLRCQCGYAAIIEDGIFLANPNPYYESDDFNLKHYQEIPSPNHDFLFFHYMDRLSEQYIAMLAKSYAWVSSEISKIQKQNRVIFVPDLSAHFLYKYINEPYFKDAYIIVTGFQTRTVKAIKAHLESLEPNLNIFFVSNTVFELPIKNKTVDLWIDVISSYNFGFFHKTSLHELIVPYLNLDAHIVGITKYFNPNAKSLGKINDLFPNQYIGNSLYNGFMETLKNNRWKLTNESDLGSVINPGSYYSYTVKDEKHFFLGYTAVHM